MKGSFRGAKVIIISMENKIIKTLEFDKIADLLAECAPTEGAKQLAAGLGVSSDPNRIIRLQNQTTDAKEILAYKGMPPFGGITDVGGIVERAKKGATLTAGELLSCANVAEAARRVKSYKREDVQIESSLDEFFEIITGDRVLEERIRRAIVSDDMIADEASPALSDIRRKMRSTGARVREILQKYTSGAYSKILQENIVTRRGGRFVIPVKTEYKNEIGGLIHDTSSSGATVFIEPLSVVEANNELRILEGKEAREIERILAELSSMVAVSGETLMLDYGTMTELAFIFARAELSYRMNASPPEINTEDGEIRLVSARHPLLDKKTCVPITVSLGGSYDTLIITGPNTGGKTVALKTIGLLTMMAAAGLHIPAENGSRIPVFEGIYADIGDEQSIEMSLSTFSSSMSNIIEILNSVNDASLVLLDEIGAGTDPVEGAALAVAIIEELRARGARSAITTHYAEIKAFAINTPGVVNAACEFDVETLKPTYRLIVGAPGKSNAFAISEKLGLQPSIVERANELLSGESKKFEDVIGKLEAARSEMERERDIKRNERIEYERFKKASEDELNRRLLGAEREAEDARRRASEMIVGARAASNYVMERMEKLKREQNSENFGKLYSETRREVRDFLRESSEKYSPEEKPVKEDMPPHEFSSGDEVTVIGTGVEGIIIEGPDKSGRVTITSNGISMKTNVSKLKYSPRENTVTDKNGNTHRVAEIQIDRSKGTKPELDIRGMTGDEGISAVDKYLDEAAMSGFSEVRVIHGKGTGALRAALHGYLRGEGRVKSFRLGTYGEGDAGVTVIELKK
ncbi:MAG: endonuclease MutS2 [Firmicutes bacterium]|nr:endonuclease MutS2 [Bacillota bacterium]